MRKEGFRILGTSAELLSSKCSANLRPFLSANVSKLRYTAPRFCSLSSVQVFCRRETGRLPWLGLTQLMAAQALSKWTKFLGDTGIFAADSMLLGAGKEVHHRHTANFGSQHEHGGLACWVVRSLSNVYSFEFSGFLVLCQESSLFHLQPFFSLRLLISGLLKTVNKS